MIATNFCAGVHGVVLRRTGTPVEPIRESNGAAGWGSWETADGISRWPRCLEINSDQLRADKKDAVAVFMYLPSRSVLICDTGSTVVRGRLDGGGVAGTGGRSVRGGLSGGEVCVSEKVNAVPVVNNGSFGFGGLGGSSESCCRGPRSHKCLSTKR